MARYAIMDDAQFKLLKSVTPGSYTFILRARREVPRRLTRKKTIGVRIPGHPVAHALLAELDQPMLSATLLLAGEQVPLSEAAEIRVRLEHELDLVIDAGSCGVEPSTVIDLTAGEPRVLRQGKGSLAPFAVERV
jgi:tRNA threonylcarbamoyl adenosine modification protein (Sua5/YciO/YrdC/YwlC family)